MFLNLVIAIIFSTAGSKAANENSKEFRDMCVLFKLAITAPDEKQVPSTVPGTEASTPKQRMSQITADIKLLNLTTVEETVVKVLDDTKDYPNAEAAITGPKAVPYFKEMTEGAFTYMRNTWVRLKALRQKTGAEKPTYPLVLSAQQRQNVAPTFYHLYTRAQQLQAALNSNDDSAKSAELKARTALITALFGKTHATKAGPTLEQGKAAASTTDPEDFPWGDTDDRDATCAAARDDGTKAGRTIATDTVCICSGGATNDQTYCTSDNIASAPQLHTSGYQAKAKAVWDQLTPQCDSILKDLPLKPTPAALEAGLANFYSHMGKNWVVVTGMPTTLANSIQTRQSIFGIHTISSTSAPACTATSLSTFGTASKGVCIQYDAYTGKGKEIPWVKKIKEAATQLAAADALFTSSVALLSEATGIRNQMETLLLMGNLLTPVAGPVPTSAAAKQPSLADQDKCKNPPNKTKQGCEAVECDYDDRKKECKPKAVTETKAAGTATDKCDKHKKQTGCEAENNDVKPGQKAVCGWMDFVDGTGKLPKPQCRSSSFLLNKQFAPMVSAFVALLFKNKFPPSFFSFPKIFCYLKIF
ncbi:variant surface glycoprotein [Trypanosoma brucei equiperdum]|uniref:Variant surface glycoprotein n=1 Tax=Trypanosoma brucei equiperdum TaxID=630700 RepID=A0A3L6L932_9TRYP|nr:variant surface glycoprotein [Trypanosoma brucei equiperdum]